jgi:hypothetical protein
MYIFYVYIYNEYIGPYFFIARCSKIFASDLPEIHILGLSLERSVKRTWTGSTFSTNVVLGVDSSRALSLMCEVALSEVG